MTTDHIPDATKMVPEALRLADHLERFRSFPDDLAAAAELRRLQARSEADEALMQQALEWIEAQPEPRMIGAAKIITALKERLK